MGGCSGLSSLTPLFFKKHMTTIPDNNHVKLSGRDWIGIVAICVALSTAMMGAFLHHDRALVVISSQQQGIEKRLDRIENQLERK